MVLEFVALRAIRAPVEGSLTDVFVSKEAFEPRELAIFDIYIYSIYIYSIYTFNIFCLIHSLIITSLDLYDNIIHHYKIIKPIQIDG